MPGSFMTGYAGFGIADEQQGEYHGQTAMNATDP